MNKKDKEHVSNLVLRRDDDYRLKKELEIGEIILKSKKYNQILSIISTCPIEFNDISDQININVIQLINI